MLEALLFLGILVAAFLLLIVRPQRRQMAAHRALVESLRVGDDVMTSSGIYVRLFPAGKAASSSLDTAKNIIDRRVNGLGVSDAEVTREGDNIVIDLPGVKDRDKAKRLVGRTAELRFRPVVAELPPAAKDAPPNDAAKAAV